MKLKTYRSETIDAAMRLAGVELGEEAIFVGSRESGAQDGQGRYEVTFALLENDAATGRTEGRAEVNNLADERPAIPPQTHGREPSEARASSEESQNAATNLPEQHPSKTRKKIERPHWKKFVPHELEDRSAKKSASGSGSEAAQQSAQAERTQTTTVSSEETVSESPPDSANQARPAAQRKNERVRPAKEEASPDAPLRAAEAPGRALNGASTAPGAGTTREQNARASSTSRGTSPSEKETSALQPASRGPNTFTAQVRDELRQIRSLLESDLSRRFPLTFSEPGWFQDPAAVRLLARILASEIEPRLLDQLLSATGSGEPPTESRIRSMIEEVCPVSARISAPGNPPQAAAFVGPSGCGKTTAVAKLAVQQGWDEGRRVHLVMADPHRVAHGELLRSYARLAEIPLTTINKPEQITTVLDNLAAAGRDEAPDIVLIDTPGYARSEWERAERLAAALRSASGIETHLVVDLSRRDLRGLSEIYSIFRPAKLLFTKLDETTAHGALLNESARTGLPLSFLCTGPCVPEDIAPATKEHVADLILGEKA